MALFGTAQALPVLEADKDKAQLLSDFRLGREVGRQGLGWRVDDIGEGGEHTFDDQVGHYVQAIGLQVLQLGHRREVGRQVSGDVFAQGSDGLAHGKAAAILLTGQEQELGTVGCHHIEKDAHGSIDDTAHYEFVVAYQAYRGAEGLADFTDQYEPELVHIGKMAVETGGNNASRLCHFTQAQAAEPPATLHKMAGCVHQGKAGLLLLFGAGQHWRAGLVDKYSDAL